LQKSLSNYSIMLAFGGGLCSLSTGTSSCTCVYRVYVRPIVEYNI